MPSLLDLNDIPLCRSYGLVKFGCVVIGRGTDQGGSDLRVVCCAGISNDGVPQLLGAWPSVDENMPWQSILLDLKVRGVERITRFSCDEVPLGFDVVSPFNPNVETLESSASRSLNGTSPGELRLAEVLRRFHRSLRRLRSQPCAKAATVAATGSWRRGEAKQRLREVIRPKGVGPARASLRA